MARKMPKLCTHRGTGQAYSTDPRTGKERYFGPAGTHQAAEGYAAFCREVEAWRAGGAAETPPPRKPRRERPLTVARLCLLFLDHAEKHYTKHGRRTSEVANFRSVVARLNARHGALRAVEFGPRHLKALRDEMAAELARQTANSHTKRVKRIWRWAVAEEFLPPERLAALEAVPGVRRGAAGVREGKKVRPVPVEVVEATLPFLSPRWAALVRFQLYGGMRPQDAVCCRPCDVYRIGTPWVYRPVTFKTEHLEGSERVIYLGPKAREALAPWLARCRKATAWVWRGRAGHVRVSGLRDAVRRAVLAANVGRDGKPLPHWHPSQLRHAAATLIRAAYGPEGSQVILGHEHIKTSEIYAEKSQALAQKIAEEMG